jgi:hypothetical protein
LIRYIAAEHFDYVRYFLNGLCGFGEPSRIEPFRTIIRGSVSEAGRAESMDAAVFVD